MVAIGYIPATKSARFSRLHGKVLSKRCTGHEHEKEQRDKNTASKSEVNDMVEKPHFDGYA